MKKKLIIIIIIIVILVVALALLLLNNNKTETVKQKPIKDKQTSETINPLETKLKAEKYYIDNNLQRYLNYANTEGKGELTPTQIISEVNCNLDKTKYEDITPTNINHNNLMLVNKYYYLTEDYTPNDLVTLTTKYNTGVNSQMRKEAAEAFMEMSDAATLDNIIIKNASAYRSYQYQVNLYDRYVERDGQDAADTYSARPGFSEHQTGLATDINQIDNGFEDTDAFRWLQDNAYKYGFILRFPKDKENITGYQYEPWHYRYVGKEIAKQIKEENITFEEYYAYYIENENNS